MPATSQMDSAPRRNAVIGDIAPIACPPLSAKCGGLEGRHAGFVGQAALKRLRLFFPP